MHTDSVNGKPSQAFVVKQNLRIANFGIARDPNGTD
jgi:hypothetical protein